MDSTTGGAAAYAWLIASGTLTLEETFKGSGLLAVIVIALLITSSRSWLWIVGGYGAIVLFGALNAIVSAVLERLYIEIPPPRA